MKKKLTRTGSCWALYFTKMIIELSKVNSETDEVELEFEGDVLKLKNAKKKFNMYTMFCIAFCKL